MTGFKLALWIGLVIGVQLLIWAAWAFWRHWLRFQALKQRLDSLEPGNRPPVAAPVSQPTSAAWSGWRSLRVVRRHLEDAAGTICSFELEPVDGKPLPLFLPGQFLTVKVSVPDGQSGSSRMVSRCYSLSNQPGEPHYRISVKRVPGGVVSNHLHEQIREGAILEVMAPSGRFVPEPGSAPTVLIAGGIGITPLLSMVQTRLASDPQSELWLFYGVRDAKERAFHDILRDLSRRHPGFRYLACHSRPQAGQDEDCDHVGRVDITLLRLTLALRPYHFYICGPTAMMDGLLPALEAWGVTRSQIHTENFGPSMGREALPEATTPPSPTKRGMLVAFRLSGKKVLWDDSAPTLLDFAENQGIEPPYGCRSGACGACQTGVTQGEVEYLENPDYTPDPGTCLLCVTRPRSDLTLTL